MTGWRSSVPGRPPPGGPSAGSPISAVITGYARAPSCPPCWSRGLSWRSMSSWPANGAVTTVPCSWPWRRWRRTAGSGRSRDPEVFTAVLRTIPTYAAWLEVMDPITGVFPMAGLHNTLRRLVVDGAPVATGLHASATRCAPPTRPSGAAWPWPWPAPPTWQTPSASTPRSRRAGRSPWTVWPAARVPFYQDQAAIDATRLAMMRHTIFGAPAPDPPPDSDRVTYAQLRAAAPYDPAAFRAFWKIMGMVRPPGGGLHRPEVVACTQETLRRHGNAPPVAQPTRDQLLAALARVQGLPPSMVRNSLHRRSPYPARREPNDSRHDHQRRPGSGAGPPGDCRKRCCKVGVSSNRAGTISLQSGV